MRSKHTSLKSYVVKKTHRHGSSFRRLFVLLGVLVATGCGQPSELTAYAAQLDPDSATSELAADSNVQAERREQALENPFPNRTSAPSLDGGVEWLNTSGEITLKDLRGKVVLLDFWTYCCINCMHVLPDLKYLEQKYPNEVVVVGVHSAKFDNEKESENIRQAIMRYEIEHPVVNDANMIIWQKFSVNSWPTLIVIDPEGYFCGYVSGEGNRDLLAGVVNRLIAYHRAKGTLDETPVRFDLERESRELTPLKYPGKVFADEAGNRLFIADSNHNRIVICNLDGTVIDTIGTGAIGASDGDYDQATFDHPQGMELVGQTLYIADTENHLIREVNLTARTVSTLAGTGKQGYARSGGALRTTALNSPWAIKHVDGVLYIAMAGRHQMWSHRLGSKTIDMFAGSGREDILNGPLPLAAMAQPSGIASDGTFLYVVDSEGSAVRKIPTDPEGEMTTIAGPSELPMGRSLFAFGDKDGVGGKARLQHPLGIVLAGKDLYVADTYNHKIKQINLQTQEVSTLLGDGQRGDSIQPPRFSEPGGLSVAGNRLYIADTNNHRICVADLGTGQVSVLNLKGLKPPGAAAAGKRPIAQESRSKATRLEARSVPTGQPVNVDIAFHLPDGFKLNQLRPVTYRLALEEGDAVVPTESLGKSQRAQSQDKRASISIPLSETTGKATVRLSVTYAYCRDGVGGLCKLDTVNWLLPLNAVSGGDPVQIALEAGENRAADPKSPLLDRAFP